MDYTFNDALKKLLIGEHTRPFIALMHLNPFVMGGVKLKETGDRKSILLSMITQNSEAEVIVVGLIGERGRELATFTREITASHSKKKVVIVAFICIRIVNYYTYHLLW